LAVGNTLLAKETEFLKLMENPTQECTADDPDDAGESLVSRSYWLPVVLSVLAMVWFFAFEYRYGGNRSQSALTWLWSAWNAENDFEHGFMFPLIVAGLMVYRWKELKAAVGEGSFNGLVVVVLGALFYTVAYRTFQPRVAIGALPFLLWGSAWYLWGWKVAKILFLPLFFFLLAIPLPSFQHATTQLQILAVSMANHGAALFGVETLVRGTQISSAHGNWEPLEIAEGCSGIRSLMALMMLSGAWACAANIALWKRAVLFLAAIPLAIIGNTLRVVSIFVIAEYGNAKWGANTWHDWSGLLLFYPISLMLLLVIHSVLEGGLPWRKPKREVRRMVVTRAASPTSASDPTATDS
jgi:exosortase